MTDRATREDHDRRWLAQYRPELLAEVDAGKATATSVRRRLARQAGSFGPPLPRTLVVRDPAAEERDLRWLEANRPDLLERVKRGELLATSARAIAYRERPGTGTARRTLGAQTRDPQVEAQAERWLATHRPDLHARVMRGELFAVSARTSHYRQFPPKAARRNDQRRLKAIAKRFPSVTADARTWLHDDAFHRLVGDIIKLGIAEANPGRYGPRRDPTAREMRAEWERLTDAARP